MNPTLKRGATCSRRIRGEAHIIVAARHGVVAGLLTEPLVPTGTVSLFSLWQHTL
jgi:hypothetical protein